MKDEKDEDKDEDEESSNETIIGIWTGSLIIVVIMIVLFRSAWWAWIVIIGSVGGAIERTISIKKSQRKCRHCGAKLEDKAEFCTRCGKPQLTKCPKCKEPLTGKGNYSDKCGSSLTDMKKIDQYSSSTSPAQLPEKSDDAAQFCPSCGTALEQNQKKCSFCGHMSNR